MITNNMGTIILGSPALETSVANQEILTGNPRVLNLSILNDQDCVMIFNNGDGVFIRAGQGKLVDVCSSIKITTNGVTFNWTGQKG